LRFIPGSQIPFVTAKDKDNATIDIIGVALASAPAKAPPTGQAAKQGTGKTPVQLAVGRLRDSVKLAVESMRDVRRKNVQHNTSFVLAPGSYHLKFVVRENQTGRMGSFETDVRILDLRKSPLKMSSVIVSSQRVPATGKKSGNQSAGPPTNGACSQHHSRLHAGPTSISAIRRL
jgi:hypothetical protein